MLDVGGQRGAGGELVIPLESVELLRVGDHASPLTTGMMVARVVVVLTGATGVALPARSASR